MATSKKTATAKRRVTAKKTATAKTPTARQSNVSKAFAHWQEGTSAYSGIVNPVYDRLIIAAFIVAGFAKLNKGEFQATTGGNATLLRGLVGKGPVGYHKSNGRLDANGITDGGAVWFQKRITTPEHVELTGKLATAMVKGGTVDGVKFSRPIAG